MQREQAIQSFAARRVPVEAMQTLVSGAVRPRTGDVVLARVSRIGNHRHIERMNGRRSVLHVGDEIILVYADRYATDQFESYVPTNLDSAHLVASGGIASLVKSRSTNVRAATQIDPIGLIGDERGCPLNIADFALSRVEQTSSRPHTIAVFGTAMNAGKTTTIHQMLHGFAKAGAKPGAAKVTGTGSGNDYWVMLDAGAHRMLDFTDAGMASTFNHSIERLEDVAEQLVYNLTIDGCQVIFLEIADGLFQQENQYLLRSPRLRALIDTVVFAASDSMGATCGVETLRQHGYSTVAISGTLTKSPLAIQETHEALNLPVLGLDEINDVHIMTPLLGIDPSILTTDDAEDEVRQAAGNDLIDVPDIIEDLNDRKDNALPQSDFSLLEVAVSDSKPMGDLIIADDAVSLGFDDVLPYPDWLDVPSLQLLSGELDARSVSADTSRHRSPTEPETQAPEVEEREVKLVSRSA